MSAAAVNTGRCVSAPATFVAVEERREEEGEERGMEKAKGELFHPPPPSTEVMFAAWRPEEDQG